jgi:predicted  nucleic acid-binding Zn-ribbon protein
LNALTDRLSPIGKVAPGTIIQAAGWNLLVGAVVEIARTVLAEDHQVTPAPHEHPDQITVGWLDPRLRAMIERGPLSDPAAMTRLSTLENRVQRLADRIEEVSARIGEVKDHVTEVATHDLVRQAEVTGVRRAVAGLSDSRESVREVRETLGALQRDVTTAVNLGQLLTVDGQLVDMTDLVTRVNRADQLRDSLRGPDGAIFDAKLFENRLTELTNTLVTQQALDEALDSVRPNISRDDLAGIEGNLSNQLLGQVKTTVDLLANDLRSETNSRFTEVNSTIDTRISNAIPNITTSLLNTVRGEISTAVSGSQTANQSLLDQRLAQLGASLSADYTRRVDNVESGIGTLVDSFLNQRLPQELVQIRGNIATLETAVSPLTGRLVNLESELVDVRSRISGQSGALDARDARLRNELLTEMDQRDQLQLTAFNSRLATLDTTLSSRFNTAIGDSQRQTLNEARVIAGDTARAEVVAAETRLRGDIATISRDSVSNVVRAEITSLQPGLTRSVARELNAGQPNVRRPRP